MKTIAFFAAAVLTSGTGIAQDVTAPVVTVAAIPQTPVDVTNTVETITAANDSGFR